MVKSRFVLLIFIAMLPMLASCKHKHEDQAVMRAYLAERQAINEQPPDESYADLPHEARMFLWSRDAERAWLRLTEETLNQADLTSESRQVLEDWHDVHMERLEILEQYAANEAPSANAMTDADRERLGQLNAKGGELETQRAWPIAGIEP